VADALRTAINELTTVLGAVAGINQAPDYYPEAANDPPMVLTYHVATEYMGVGTSPMGLHEVHADVVLSRSTLPHDIEQAEPFLLLIMDAIATNTTLSSTCQHCILQRQEGPQVINVPGGEAMMGIHNVLQIKIHHTGTTYAA
jgi:hypothetical protein